MFLSDPEDFKYVLNPKTERRKNRHHTVAADSGYSTLTDDTSRSLRDVSLLTLNEELYVFIRLPIRSGRFIGICLFLTGKILLLDIRRPFAKTIAACW